MPDDTPTCAVCDEPMMAGQIARHQACAPMCVECFASVDSRSHQGHTHRVDGPSWHLVLAWIARRVQPPEPVRWWTPGLHDIDEDEFALMDPDT